jgi:hypothetical protein
MARDAHNRVLLAFSRCYLQGSFQMGNALPRLSGTIIRQIRREQKAANGKNRA